MKPLFIIYQVAAIINPEYDSECQNQSKSSYNKDFFQGLKRLNIIYSEPYEIIESIKNLNKKKLKEKNLNFKKMLRKLYNNIKINNFIKLFLKITSRKSTNNEDAIENYHLYSHKQKSALN